MSKQKEVMQKALKIRRFLDKEIGAVFRTALTGGASIDVALRASSDLLAFRLVSMKGISDKSECWSACHAIRPDITWEDFERMWANRSAPSGAQTN